MTDKPHSHHAPHKSHFYLGILTGALLGAGLAYFAQQKKSDQLKDNLITKAKQLAHQLPQWLDEWTDTQGEVEQGTQKLAQITSLFTSDPESANPQSTPKDQSRSVKPKDSPVHQVRRFFNKAGKLLK